MYQFRVSVFKELFDVVPFFRGMVFASSHTEAASLCCQHQGIQDTGRVRVEKIEVVVTSIEYCDVFVSATGEFEYGVLL